MVRISSLHGWLRQTSHRTLTALQQGCPQARTVLELALKGVELEDQAVRVKQLEVARNRWLGWVDQAPPASILAPAIGILSIRTWLDQISRVT